MVYIKTKKLCSSKDSPGRTKRPKPRGNVWPVARAKGAQPDLKEEQETGGRVLEGGLPQGSALHMADLVGLVMVT